MSDEMVRQALLKSGPAEVPVGISLPEGLLEHAAARAASNGVTLNRFIQALVEADWHELEVEPESTEKTPEKQIPEQISTPEPPPQVTAVDGIQRGLDSAARGEGWPAERVFGHRMGTVAITFQVPSALRNALADASYHRRMRGVQPFTQTGILTELMTNWLKAEGYL